jgi:hypothetical protein
LRNLTDDPVAGFKQIPPLDGFLEIILTVRNAHNGLSIKPKVDIAILANVHQTVNGDLEFLEVRADLALSM